MKKLLLTLLFSVSIISPVFAQAEQEATTSTFEVKFYGDLSMDMFYSYGSNGSFERNSNILSWNNEQHSLASENFFGSSYFGVHINYDKISLYAELGVNDPFRQYFLTYNFGDQYNQTFSFGRATTLAHYEMGQVSHNYAGLNNYGTLSDDVRRLQFRYGLNYRSHQFQLALIMPYLGDGYTKGNDFGYNYRNAQDAFLGMAYIPRMEFAYKVRALRDLDIKTYGGYGAFFYTKEDDKLLADADIVHTASLGVGGQYRFLNRGFLDFTAWGGLNLYLINAIDNEKLNPVYGYMSDNYLGSFFQNDFGHSDIISFGAAIAAGYEFKDFEGILSYIPQIGVGYMGSYSDVFKEIDHAAAAYANVTFRINNYFDIIPEVVFMYDFTDAAGNNEGYSITAGVNARFHF